MDNRKLRDTADPSCTEWVTFRSRLTAEPIFGGLSHFDRIVFPGDEAVPAWEGFTLRQFDPHDKVWRIWWASTRTEGRLDPPLTGRFTDGVGTFHGTDLLGTVPICLRFRWSTPGPDAATWTQEFSYDDGAGWTHNWTMQLRRDG